MEHSVAHDDISSVDRESDGKNTPHDLEESLKSEHHHAPTSRQHNSRVPPSDKDCPLRSCQRRKAMKPCKRIFRSFEGKFKRVTPVSPQMFAKRPNSLLGFSRRCLETILEETFTHVQPSKKKEEMTNFVMYKLEQTHSADPRVEYVQKLLTKMDL